MNRVCFAWTVGAALALGAGGHARSAAAAVGDRATQAETGFLDISSDPPAKITIDDVDTGKVTPQPRLELKVGHHKLMLETLDGKRKRGMGFNIDLGQTTKLSLHLAS